jgi:hypothetical protein
VQEGIDLVPDAEIVFRSSATDLAEACLDLLRDDLRARSVEASARERVRALYDTVDDWDGPSSVRFESPKRGYEIDSEFVDDGPRASAIAAGFGQAIMSNQRFPSWTSWKTVVRMLEGAGLKVIWSMCVAGSSFHV